jgi:hypothetical protein
LRTGTGQGTEQFSTLKFPIRFYNPKVPRCFSWRICWNRRLWIFKFFGGEFFFPVYVDGFSSKASRIVSVPGF